MNDLADEATADRAPVFSVVHGSPSDEELAALWVVLALSGSADATPPPPPAAGWSAYWRQVRAPLLPGPGAWRASGRL